MDPTAPKETAPREVRLSGRRVIVDSNPLRIRWSGSAFVCSWLFYQPIQPIQPIPRADADDAATLRPERGQVKPNSQ